MAQVVILVPVMIMPCVDRQCVPVLRFDKFDAHIGHLRTVVSPCTTRRPQVWPRDQSQIDWGAEAFVVNRRGAPPSLFSNICRFSFSGLAVSIAPVLAIPFPRSIYERQFSIVRAGARPARGSTLRVSRSGKWRVDSQMGQGVLA